jgi:hypothetical protein
MDGRVMKKIKQFKPGVKNFEDKPINLRLHFEVRIAGLEKWLSDNGFHPLVQRTLDLNEHLYNALFYGGSKK